MPKILWDESFCIGNELIDKQHRELIDYFNAAHEQMLSNQNISDLGTQALIRMVEYCKYHCNLEEEYMEKIGFPDIERHKELHKNILKTLDRHLQESAQGEPILTSEILKIFKDWLIHHVITEDKNIA